ncbi:MAG: outer membrane beta-barrel protein [Sphingomicrobium sp.]
MRNLLLATAAILAIATPAAARDNSGYVGLEGGVMFPNKSHVDASVDFTDPLVVDLADREIARVDHKTGYDIDAIAGYDFGMFRIEGELGYKRAKNKELEIDQDFIDDLNAGAGTAFIASDYDLGGHTSVKSAMLNGLVDFGPDNGINGYVGAGVGRAKVKAFGESDSGWAYQLIAGVRMPVSDAIDVGLKYRYFRTGKLNFNNDVPFTGVGVGSGGTVFLDNDTKYSSHSLLASLIFNFGGVAAPAPMEPVPVMAPPPPPPMATQTCSDGSVIPATSYCPAPPPPPPAPVERGERGQ